MEQILQMVSGSELFSLLDGFSGYNQVLVAEQDRLKTTFRTNWGESLLSLPGIFPDINICKELRLPLRVPHNLVGTLLFLLLGTHALYHHNL